MTGFIYHHRIVCNGLCCILCILGQIPTTEFLLYTDKPRRAIILYHFIALIKKINIEFIKMPMRKSLRSKLKKQSGKVGFLSISQHTHTALIAFYPVITFEGGIRIVGRNVFIIGDRCCNGYTALVEHHRLLLVGHRQQTFIAAIGRPGNVNGCYQLIGGIIFFLQCIIERKKRTVEIGLLQAGHEGLLQNFIAVVKYF